MFAYLENSSILESDIPFLLDDKGKMLPWSALNEKQRYYYQLNAKIRHNLMYALSEEEISHVHIISYVVEMRDTLTLALAHEGSKEYKHNKLSLQRHQCKMFTMEEWFCTIYNY